MVWLAIVLGIIGFIVWVICRVYKNDDEDYVKTTRSAGKWSLVIGTVLMVFFFAIACITVIPAGHIGVKVLFGSVKKDILAEGLHFRNPFMSIKKMTIQTQSYTMSIVQEEGKVKGNDAIDALTRDNLTVTMDLTVLYRLYASDAPRLYQILGFTDIYTEKIVRPGIRTAIRNSAAKFTASEIMGDKRSVAERDIQTELGKIFKEYFSRQNIENGLECERVMLRNVNPPAKLKEAIENKLKAEQDAQAMEFKLQQARKEAEKRVIEAQGIADAQKIINKTLTSEYIQWYYIETLKSLVDSPNNSTIILPFDQKLTPMFQIPTGNKSKE